MSRFNPNGFGQTWEPEPWAQFAGRHPPAMRVAAPDMNKTLGIGDLQTREPGLEIAFGSSTASHQQNLENIHHFESLGHQDQDNGSTFQGATSVENRRHFNSRRGNTHRSSRSISSHHAKTKPVGRKRITTSKARLKDALDALDSVKELLQPFSHLLSMASILEGSIHSQIVVEISNARARVESGSSDVDSTYHSMSQASASGDTGSIATSLDLELSDQPSSLLLSDDDQYGHATSFPEVSVPTIDEPTPRQDQPIQSVAQHATTSYHCIFQKYGQTCDYQTTREGDWIRHGESEKHFPQKRYMCISCITPRYNDEGHSFCAFCSEHLSGQGNDKQHYLQCERCQIGKHIFAGARRHHFSDHLRSKHGLPGIGAEETTWEFDVRGEWPSECGFCGDRFSSWSARTHHIAEHFRNGANIHTWKLPFGKARAPHDQPDVDYKKFDDDDDDDDDGDDQFGGGGGGSVRQRRTHDSSTSSSSHASSSGYHSQDWSSFMDYNMFEMRRDSNKHAKVEDYLEHQLEADFPQLELSSGESENLAEEESSATRITSDTNANGYKAGPSSRLALRVKPGTRVTWYDVLAPAGVKTVSYNGRDEYEFPDADVHRIPFLDNELEGPETIRISEWLGCVEIYSENGGIEHRSVLRKRLREYYSKWIALGITISAGVSLYSIASTNFGTGPNFDTEANSSTGARLIASPLCILNASIVLFMIGLSTVLALCEMVSITKISMFNTFHRIRKPKAWPHHVCWFLEPVYSTTRVLHKLISKLSLARILLGIGSLFFCSQLVWKMIPANPSDNMTTIEPWYDSGTSHPTVILPFETQMTPDAYYVLNGCLSKGISSDFHNSDQDRFSLSSTLDSQLSDKIWESEWELCLNDAKGSGKLCLELDPSMIFAVLSSTCASFIGSLRTAQQQCRGIQL